MERNTTKGGFWMMVESLDTEPIREEQRADAKNGNARDDDFYPDASI
jgi:hypothetical protein